MQDPSYGVAQQLQNHVHLISGHRFPILQALSLDNAYRYLIDAPTIVSKTAPMSWMYVQAPQDGTVWLEWISPRTGDYRFASDGYIWGEPEQTFRHEYGGYTVEILVHSVGYRPGYDHMASHARTRYHFVAKNPATNAAPPDPSLWIVHYHQTDHGRQIPAQQVPVSPHMRQFMGERRMLEAQGRLERKDFMLHDREHWPAIHVPGGHMQQQQGYHGNPNVNLAQHRFPQMPTYQQMPGPPSKRPRYSGSGAGPASSEGVHDANMEEEENVALGDFFDHLTPREISMARYLQHHRWIEEVFSSPYSSSQIVPPDLGLGLMGELKGLTDGILQPPSLDEITRTGGDLPPKPKEAQPFTNLKKEQFEEFKKRVERHLEEGQAEIEKMKEKHAAQMAEWKRSKGIMEAENRLRYATWEGHEAALPAFRLEILPVNGQREAGAPETVENVVKDVERIIGKKIGSHQNATMIQRGGLEKEEELTRDDPMEFDPSGPQDEASSLLHDGLDGDGQLQATTSDQEPTTAAETKVDNLSMPQATYQQGQAQQPSQDAVTRQSGLPGPSLDGIGGIDIGDASLVDGMDMDVGDDINADGVDFGDIQTDIPTETETTNPPDPPEIPATVAAAASQPLVSDAQQPAPVQSVEQSTMTTTAETSAVAGDAGTIGNAEDNGIFDDNTFADLADMGDGGDDGLLDFEGGMGMDESAFGDAMHGMDAQDGQDEQAREESG